MNSTQVTCPETFGKTSDKPATAPGKLKTFVARTLMILVSVVIGLTIAEICVRMLGWPAPGFEVNGRGPIALRQPGLPGGAFPPESSGRLKNYDYDVGWTVNTDGFRERGLYPKKTGEWRLGILGDSFAAGFGVEQNQRFTDVWYQEAKAKHPQLTTWNLASPLCGTICEQEILDGVGRHYELDEWLLAFYGGNDVEDNFERATHPDTQDPFAELSSSERTRQWLREHSRLSTFLWVNAIRAFASVKPPGIYTQTDLNRYWPYTATALAKLKSSLDSGRLTILYIPALPEWDDQTWRKVRERSGASDDDRFLVQQAVKNWAQQENIAFIDATPWLRQCRVADDCTFPTDGHLNVRGHAIVGRELANAWRIEGPDERP